MPKFRFRRTIDVDIEAETPEEALYKMTTTDAYPRKDNNFSEDFELLGKTSIENLSPELLKAAEKMNNFVLMSVQYRGENFACMCQVEDIDPEYVSVKPVALLLSEEQKDHLTDVVGGSPEAGLRKKMNL